MAIVIEWYYSVQLIDSRGQTSTHSIRVNDVDAALWIGAADDAARAATDIGTYQGAVVALSDAVFVSANVSMVTKDDAYTQPAPDANVYHFDKLTAGYKVGLERYTLTIPSRKDTAYNVAPNGIDVLIAGAGAAAAVTNWITRFEAIALDNDGDGPVDVTYMKVSS